MAESQKSADAQKGNYCIYLLGLRSPKSEDTPHFQDPSCVWFTLQDNLPAETVQMITYGAPEMSAYLAMSLMG